MHSQHGLRRLLPALAALAVTGLATAAPPEYAVKNAGETPYVLVDAIRQSIPPLKHERGKRWPLILWEAGPFAPQPPEYYRDLLARGIVQHIQMTTDMIPTAKLLQEAGAPVIMMQGAGGSWPADLAGDKTKWGHQFEPGYTPKEYHRPCLYSLEGWAIQADNVRRILRAYRDAGITVAGVWMDWEGDPMGGHDLVEQAQHCLRCRETLPPGLLTDAGTLRPFRWRLYMDLLGAYLAAPVKEIFPKCETTNWMVTVSTPERPLRFWDNRVLPPTMPAWFTATNPIAYGNTDAWHWRNPQWPLTLESVDQFYAHLLLRMVSDDTANRLKWAPYLKSFPWVDRWCPDDEDPKIPIMSRERYREVLRHLWLRGVNGMQIFNPKRAGYKEITFGEVEDAVSVYDEMLEYADFLERGTVLCTDYPAAQDNGVIWSGLRLDDRAVVRLFKQGGGEATIRIEPWPLQTIELRADAASKTYRLRRTPDKVTVEE